MTGSGDANAQLGDGARISVCRSRVAHASGFRTNPGRPAADLVEAPVEHEWGSGAVVAALDHSLSPSRRKHVEAYLRCVVWAGESREEFRA